MAQRTSQEVMDGGSALPSETAPGRCNPHQRAPRPALAKEDHPLRYPAQALSPADPCNKVIPCGKKRPRPIWSPITKPAISLRSAAAESTAGDPRHKTLIAGRGRPRRRASKKLEVGVKRFTRT